MVRTKIEKQHASIAKILDGMFKTGQLPLNTKLCIPYGVALKMKNNKKDKQ